MFSGYAILGCFIDPNAAPLLTSVAAILKSFAWPLGTVILAFRFHKQIVAIASSVTQRLTSIKVPGVIEANLIAEQAQTSVTTPTTTIALAALPDPTPAVAKMERETQKLLDAVPPDEQVARLTRACAVQTLNAGFAVLYAIIFGSQIKALIELRARRRTTAAEALQFFRPYSEQYPQIYESYGFAGWIGFLRDKELIEQVEALSYQITDYGDEFVAWIQSMGLSPEKTG